ncbi:hypothetical protein [Empedobacter tilapiae]|uniref:hypothetical protein n=1 Tax=Empedobacter tilapiae TaxID=2491114 RepID=UPI0028CFDDFE|nr:hypothetical protein [Empedobacter tilapiae]
MKKNIVLLALLAFGKAFGQAPVGQNNYNIDLYPKTPEAYAFAKFVDIPAGSYTGVANFNIPIYTIEVDGLSIPIQLDYSTAGVKVDEIASRVGLGWNLNAGPSLAVQTIGARDTSRPKVNTENFHPNGITTAEDISYSIAKQATGMLTHEPVLDLKPDIYTYSLPKENGKFINDSNNKPINIPYNDVKIVKKDLFTYELIDGAGNHYFFSSLLATNNTSSCSDVTADNTPNPIFHLNKIQTKNDHIINFNYEINVDTYYVTGFSEQYIVEEIPAVDIYNWTHSNKKLPPFCISSTRSYEPVLTSITYDHGSIEFLYNINNSRKNRNDLPGEAFLENIIVKSKNLNIIKNYEISTDYFQSNLYINPSLKSLLSEEYLRGLNKRLKLNSVIEKLSNQKYFLNYYEDTPLPNRLSYNQDYWGVFNGSDNKSTSIASHQIRNFNSTETHMFPEKIGKIGADKNPKLNFAIQGNIKDIIYPTGGKTSIEYELDDYLTTNYEQENYIKKSENFYSNLNTPYKDFNVGSLATNFVIDFNKLDNSTSLPAPSFVNDCTLTILDKSNNIPIINTQNYGIFNNDAYIEKLRGKNLRMFVTPGENLESENPVVHCRAEISWIDKDVVIIPEYTGQNGTIRVSKIEKINNSGENISVNYKYINPFTNKTSGKLFSDTKLRSYYTKPFIVSYTANHGLHRVITNNPGWQTNTVRGKAIGYDYVQEIYTSNDKKYKTVYKYNNLGKVDSFSNDALLNTFYPLETNPKKGEIEEISFYNDNNTLIKHIKHELKEDYYFNKNSNDFEIGSSSGIGYSLDIIPLKDEYGWTFASFEFGFNQIVNAWVQNKKTTTTDYFPNGSIVTTTENHYSPTYKHLYPTSVITKNSKGETLTTEYQYPPDLVSDYEQSEIMQEMVKRNMIATPVITKSINEPTVLSEQRTLYKYFPGTSGNLILPEFVYAKKGKNTTVNDRKITYNSYDAKGNLTQYTLENGIPVAIIWGYNGQYPVAKIEGSTFANATSKLANYLTKIQNGTLTATEQSTIRTLIPDAMLTSYTYKPLIGVTSITGPNGQSEFYNYDSSNRLQSIVNEKNEVIKTFEYNYKQP